MTTLQYIVKGKTAILTEDFQFFIRVKNSYRSIVIKAGYEWDGCTGGGWITRKIVGLNRFGEHSAVSLKHDYGYKTKGWVYICGELVYIPRKVWDNQFRNGLKEIRFKGFRLWLINCSVRFFGAFWWYFPIK